VSDFALWSWQLIGAMILNGIVQAATVGAYAARIAGVSTKRIAISISLFSLFVTASRLANLFYAPLLGTISDRTGNAVARAIAAGSAQLAAPTVSQFEFQLRLIVFAGTLGTLVGANLVQPEAHPLPLPITGLRAIPLHSMHRLYATAILQMYRLFDYLAVR